MDLWSPDAALRLNNMNDTNDTSTTPVAPTAWALRLAPGDDLRRALEAAVSARGLSAAFVLAGIGSLSCVQLRLAGAQDTLSLQGDLEILTLCGSIAVNGSHLHASVADSRGQVLGGHLGYGCEVRTTAEVLLVGLPDVQFRREPDVATRYAELTIRRTGA
jgi:predicted DNA-binding protein with PD1-like motif